MRTANASARAAAGVGGRREEALPQQVTRIPTQEPLSIICIVCGARVCAWRSAKAMMHMLQRSRRTGLSAALWKNPPPG